MRMANSSMSSLLFSRRRWSNAMIPMLLIILRLIICPSEAFSPHNLQHAQLARIKVQLNNDPLWQHHHRNTVLSVYSPVLLQLAADDDNNDILVQEQDAQQKSLIRRVLTFPFRLLKRPIRYLRRKIGKGDSSQEGDVETAAQATTVVAVETESRQDTTLDTKSPIEDEKQKKARDAVPKATKKAPLQPVVSSGTIMDRSPTCAKSVDLSGHWDLLVTDEFKAQYDNYLTLLGQPYLVRSVALSIVALTTEETKQTDNGRCLSILGRNLRGVWERNLITDDGTQQQQQSSFVPLQTEIVTADGENVMAEAWWEDQGTTHRSWLRGVKKYGGGDFESKRFLEKDGILVCQSTFHPNDPKREKAKVTWRFTRQQQQGGGGKS